MLFIITFSLRIIFHSFLRNSYELFLKNEWKIIRKEKVIINNIFFERYKMTKIIKIN